jgi:uncharacterized protein (TIGR03085 family)
MAAGVRLATRLLSTRSLYDRGVTAFSRTERAALCDVLEDVGPEAPTLCEGWTTYDLAAHLVLRERDPLAVPGIVVPALAGLTDRGMRRLKAAHDYATLVDRLRGGPPIWSPMGWPKIEPAVNTMEFFVHHEDVLRAIEPTARRDLPARSQGTIWAGIKAQGNTLARRCPTGLSLVRTDSDASTTVNPGEPVATVRGLPAEIALYLFGRGSVADVEIDGPAEAMQQLASSDFSV